MSDRPNLVQTSLGIAAATLSDRGRRRQFISGLLAFILAIFVLGNWPMRMWIESSPWRMLVWWGFCGFLCLILVLFALFDALSVIGEERRKMGMGSPLDDSEKGED